MTKERAQRGHTHDPWPCCGKDSGYARGRAKNTICPDCRKLIWLGKKTLEQQAAAKQAVFIWVKEEHWWPMYYGPYDFPDHEMGRRLANAMYALATRIVEDTDAWVWNDKLEYLLTCGESGRSSYTHEGRKAVSIDPALCEALDELDAAIRESLEGVFKEGQAQGRSIMLQLAAGTLSMEDYNRQTLKR